VAESGPEPLAGVVLCGGGSTRMGRDKALLDIAGRPLVLRVAQRIGRACHPVLLAPGRPGRLGELGHGLVEVADAVPDAGPLGGLVAALEASPHRLMAAVAVDLPFASPAVLAMLASSCGDADAAVPRTDRGLQPLHAVYARTAVPALRRALSERRVALHAALADLRVIEVPPSRWRERDPEGRFAVNLNGPEDLAALDLATEDETGDPSPVG
jgi:molybdenum cofactor guanylyltransferase